MLVERERIKDSTPALMKPVWSAKDVTRTFSLRSTKSSMTASFNTKCKHNTELSPCSTFVLFYGPNLPSKNGSLFIRTVKI